ncbi:MAG: Proline-tRNA ligase [Parcubacteria group bacterium GW2011_GWC2_39_14]|nr:MAG: Proline-tRNA ligase [Parcubacteria group bacterium GW2011_GWC2_39_14]KKR55369.1 MAG: Proline-tRNA ligase [Parcubacteria group bacterium GW2011_GWA2_40_23]
MRQSKLFGKTQKETPSDAVAESQKLLHRAGYVRDSVAGRYYFLPLGMRVHEKIEKIIREEMDRTGAEQILTPTLHQLELWKETNRTDTAGFELMKVKDRNGAEFALGGTAEEMIVDVVRKFNISYKDLPFNIYQFSNKFRDEMRARGGLLRTREFIMKDAYSFHETEADFKKEYEKMWKAYETIFARMGLKTVAIESDNGYIGGEYCHEFIVESASGESKALTTEDGTYAAHEEVAKFKRDNKNLDESLGGMIEVEAKRENTMQAGVELHKLPLWQQIKNVLFVTEKGRFILAVIRGDLAVNELKLVHAVGALILRAATDEEIRSIGTEPGFIGPVGLDHKKVTVVGDLSLRTAVNFCTGANKQYCDLQNVNIDRDFNVDKEADIALAEAGFLSESGKELREIKGIEVGNIFQLGYHYSKLMNATFTGKDGKEEFYYMGCYGIGLGRTMATIVEMHNDEKGIIWPEAVAPFQVHLLTLGEDEKVMKASEQLYEELLAAGIEVLFDDRDLSAGIKLKDSDLIGLPKRIVVSTKTLEQNKVELKLRSEDEIELVDISSIAKKV